MVAPLNLMLHCGGVNATRDEVLAAETPAPSGRHFPIPHEALIETFERSVKDRGLEIVTEAHGLMKHGRRHFGLYQLRNGKKDDDYSLVAGLRNSHDKKFAAGLVCGSGVFVCDNLAFSGEIAVGRVHTRNIMKDLPRLMGDALGQLHDMRVAMDERLDVYRTTKITDEVAHHAMMVGLREKAVPFNKLRGLDDEWVSPSHEEHAEDGKTAWRLFNAFTESVKGNLAELPRRTRIIHSIVDRACGIAA